MKCRSQHTQIDNIQPLPWIPTNFWNYHCGRGRFYGNSRRRKDRSPIIAQVQQIWGESVERLLSSGVRHKGCCLGFHRTNRHTVLGDDTIRHIRYGISHNPTEKEIPYYTKITQFMTRHGLLHQVKSHETSLSHSCRFTQDDTPRLRSVVAIDDH